MDIDHYYPLVQQLASVNPYRLAASYFYSRLMWDIKKEAWRSRRKLKGLKDKYEGEKAVILCNGPSLLKVDFSLLE